jgi:hypothetical protein
MDELFRNFPVSLRINSSSNRCVVAARDINCGELILRSSAVGVSSHRKHTLLFCGNCLRYSEDPARPLTCRCDSCDNIAYCSESCRTSDALIHKSHCAQLAGVMKSKNLGREEASHVRMLFRILCTCAFYISQIACSSEPGGIAVSGEPLTATLPGLDHLLFMLEDSKEILGFKKRVCQREIAAREFVALLPPLLASIDNETTCDVTSLSGQLRACPQFRSAAFCASVLARGPPNEFGICDIDGETCGCCFFPAAAMINHSCLPTSAVQLEGKNLTFYATAHLV